MVKNKQLLTEIENINRLIGYDRSKPVLEQSENLSQRVKRIMGPYGKCTGSLPYDVTNGVKNSDTDNQIRNKISKNIYEGISYLMYQRSGWGQESTFTKCDRLDFYQEGLIRDLEIWKKGGITKGSRKIEPKFCYNYDAAEQKKNWLTKPKSRFDNGEPNYHVQLVTELGSPNVCKFFQMLKETPEPDWGKGTGRDTIKYMIENPEVILDIISVVSVFFGPVGLAVSIITGLMSAGVSFAKGDVSSGVSNVMFELFPITRIGKRVSKFFKLATGDDFISLVNKLNQGLSPSEISKLTKQEKEILDILIKNSDEFDKVIKQMESPEYKKLYKSFMMLSDDEIKLTTKNFNPDDLIRIKKLLKGQVNELSDLKRIYGNLNEISDNLVTAGGSIGLGFIGGLTAKKFVEKYFDKLPSNEQEKLINSLDKIPQGELKIAEADRIRRFIIQVMVERRGADVLWEIGLDENQYNNIGDLPAGVDDKLLSYLNDGTVQERVNQLITNTEITPKKWNELNK